MTIGSTLAFPRGDSDGDVSGDIFQQGDPRGFYRVMFGLNYTLPDTAAAMLRQVIRRLAQQKGRPIKVLELGSGYGTLAALTRYSLDMNTLAHRYRDLDWSEIDSEQLIALDQNYFSSWPDLLDVQFVGFDVHEGATQYARQVGLIEESLSLAVDLSDLNQPARLAETDREILKDVDLIVSLNCSDFLSPETFSEILGAIETEDPWCAIYALRVSPFYAYEVEAERRGLKAEKLDGLTFVQRRFASSQEWTQVLLALETLGIPVAGKEGAGLLHAEFHMLRPEAAIESLPLQKLVSVTHSHTLDFANWRGWPWGV